MKVWIDKARRPEMIGGIGGFAGLFDASALKSFDHPLLATSADGVGTKVAIAQAMDIHHTIGFDLVGMLVDDLVVCGAEPLFLTDYIATGRVVPERIAAIVQGIAEACVAGRLRAGRRRDRRAPRPARPRRVRRRRLDHRRRRGGRPARPRPGRGRRRGRSRWRRAGCTPTATRWSGTCCSRGGRRLVAGPARRRARPHARRGAARADPDLRQGLPRPGPQHRARTRCRTSPAAAWPPTSSGCCPTTWSPPSTAAPGRRQPIFDLVRRVGSVAQADLERTLNCGVGMVAITARRRRRPGASRLLAGARRAQPGSCGEVGEAPARPARRGGTVTLRGQPPGLVRRPAPAGAIQPTADTGLICRGLTCGNRPRARYRWAHEKLQERPDARVAQSRLRETNRRQRVRRDSGRVARGSTLWGAAERRRSRPRLPAI